MNELALFAGAGGGILASELLGWRTVCAVEVNDYARSVLLARQNDRILRPFPVWDDVTTFDGKPWRGFIDVVSGGFPCVDISIARAMWGRDGIAGDKSGLWFEYLRIVDEVQPRFVWGENSPELKAQGLAEIVRSLASRGYVCRWITLGADDCGMPHARKRLWFLATNTNQQGLEGHPRHGHGKKRWQDQGGQAADAAFFLCPFCGHQMETDDTYGCPNCEGEGLDGEDCGAGIQPGITGMADGVANRVDRLRAVGNGQVPRVAARAFRILLTDNTRAVRPTEGGQ
jgi:DNA (cytosine-5)-methyltransferase 1